MQAIFKYRSGEIRVINLTLEFFRTGDISVSSRANDLANSFAPDVYDIKVWRDEVMVYDKFIRHMLPVKGVNRTKKVDEKEIKKALRKEFKGKKLTKISFDTLNDLSQ